MNDSSRQDIDRRDEGLPQDAGNGMSSRSEWTGRETAGETGDTETPAQVPNVGAGTALGGDPTRQTDQAPEGIPEADNPAQGSGTTFDASNRSGGL